MAERRENLRKLKNHVFLHSAESDVRKATQAGNGQKYRNFLFAAPETMFR